MNVITEYSGYLKKGDLIVISYNNGTTIGIYLGRGKGGSMQFYRIEHLCKWWEKTKGSTHQLPYKSYINNPYPDRVIKYDKTLLCENWRNLFDIAFEAFEHLNKTEK